MSIYWAPDDDEPAPARSQASLARDVSALIYEHAMPWDAPAVRALMRRIVARALGFVRVRP